MAVLRQQLVFVEHLQETGMLSEREAGLMSVPIDMRIRKLSHQGPVWRAPLTHDVLRSIPILHEVRTSEREQQGCAVRTSVATCTYACGFLKHPVLWRRCWVITIPHIPRPTSSS